MGVDRLNTKKLFEKKSNIYDKFRPRYPPELYEYITRSLGIQREHTIADIGSGTGLFCEPFIRSGSIVFAVEPNEGMRKFAENKYAFFSNFRSINGDFSNTTLRNNSVDLITVAQAFHYFNLTSFKRECLRILKNPNKYIIIIWNRKIDNELERERRRIAEEYCPLYSKFSKNSVSKENSIIKFFGGLFFTRLFKNYITNTYEEFIGRSLSSYYAPAEEELQFNNYRVALSNYFDRYAENGKLIVPNETVAYIGTLNTK
jgi:SAM-dependent methyltransferase